MPENKIKQAVLLSAGFGTRIRSLFTDIPKVMIPILGKPILEWHIERLKQYGITEIFINLHYLPEIIRGHFGDGSKFGVKISYELEMPEIRGTAGGFKNFEDRLQGDFFVIYGDVFNLIDYAKMAEAYAGHPEAIGMTIVGMNDHPHDSDLVTVADDSRLIKIYPKPNKELPPNFRTMRSNFIFNERVLKYVPAKTYYETEKQLLPDLLDKGEKLYGYESGDFMKDAGTPERYAQVEEYLKSSHKK